MAPVGYVYKGRFLSPDEYYAAKAADAPKRSHLSKPMIASDNIELRSQTDGKMYTSKAALRAEYRRAGVIEVGNEKQNRPATKEYVPQGVRDDVRQAIARHK